MKKEDGNSTENQRQGSSWIGIILSTLAAFIGVQSDKNRQRDFQQKSILPFMLVGIIMAAVFIGGLVAVAKIIAP